MDTVLAGQLERLSLDFLLQILFYSVVFWTFWYEILLQLVEFVVFNKVNKSVL